MRFRILMGSGLLLVGRSGSVEALAAEGTSQPTNPTPIPPPPAISMPVWSLACRANSPTTTTTTTTTTSMNLMTFCTPVSVAPRLWALALYHGTLTKDSFLESQKGILQLLAPSHAPLVPLLGKQSGYQVDKAQACARAGWEWEWEDDLEHAYLPGCPTYLGVELESTIDAGDHLLAICRITHTGTWKTVDLPDKRGASRLEWTISHGTAPTSPPALDASQVLYTGWLREQGLL